MNYLKQHLLKTAEEQFLPLFLLVISSSSLVEQQQIRRDVCVCVCVCDAAGDVDDAGVCGQL